MAYTTRYRYTNFYPSGRLPQGVKWLLISNVAVFLLMYLTGGTSFGSVFSLFALAPVAVIYHLAIWQLATYLFLHAGIWHLLVNMFTLWMFGISLEGEWGTRRFLKYYFLCGIGAGICDVVVSAMVGNWGTRTVGASGAIYGLLLAFGVLYPNQTIFFNFLFPIKAKYFVMIYGAIELLSAFSANSSGVSNIAHLGGMLFGYAYLKLRLPALDLGGMRQQYRTWKLQRAKRKFQVYMKKHGSNRDPWVN